MLAAVHSTFWSEACERVSKIVGVAGRSGCREFLRVRLLRLDLPRSADCFGPSGRLLPQRLQDRRPHVLRLAPDRPSNRAHLAAQRVDLIE